jgi:hypothetical protein
LEEEQRATVILTEEARTAAAVIKPPSPIGVLNICSLILVTLDLSSMHYARRCDNVLLTLGCYSLSLSLTTC